ATDLPDLFSSLPDWTRQPRRVPPDQPSPAPRQRRRCFSVLPGRIASLSGCFSENHPRWSSLRRCCRICPSSCPERVGELHLPARHAPCCSILVDFVDALYRFRQTRL